MIHNLLIFLFGELHICTFLADLLGLLFIIFVLNIICGFIGGNCFNIEHN